MDRLRTYREKRDFGRTPEPEGTGAASALALRYSVQKHEATRTHFDLRLEWEGVLLSWAITRGPSFRPSEKRLAVRTEDHPLSYLAFEGEIPKGNYGAGTVMLWDTGHWRPTEPVAPGLRKGHLRFVLHGQRLTGGWHLVRMQGRRPGDDGRENWLLLKDDDDAAGQRDPVARHRRGVLSRRTFRQIAAGAEPPAPGHDGSLPKFRAPQLATLTEPAVEGADWWHELKFDGYRALIGLGRGGPRVWTRNGLDWTERFRSLLPGFDALACRSALIDGEIVAGAGLQGFSAMQKAIEAGGPFAFHAFDLLERDGRSLTAEPLSARRKALEQIFREVPPLAPVALSPVIEGDASASLEAVCGAGGEGLIAKRRDAPYRGGRGTSWLKVKCRRREEFVVIGWQESAKRGRPFASLLLGTHEAEGLVYAGKVGSGFDSGQMAGLAAAMAPLAQATPPAEVPPAESRGARWVTPRLVAEVGYAERTEQGRVRHAVFHGLREDKPARTVRREVATMRSDEHEMVAGIAVTSPGRVVFPEAGITKREVAAYYEAISDRMLPTCADRPLSLVRLPEGLAGERFFQKHAGKGFPAALKTVDITESDGDRAPYMYVTSAKGLVAAAQMGTIEFHIWGSRRDSLDRPDRMVFDLDPDPSVGWDDVAAAAADLRDRLADLGLPCWPLVSGGKGVHVVVPLRRVAPWETVKLYARIFARHLATREPGRYVAEMSKARRKGRIFVDWLRNERGATAIAPFSLRAQEGAPAAVPVAWDELAGLPSAQAFPLPAALERDWTGVGVPDPVGLTAALIARLEKAVG